MTETTAEEAYRLTPKGIIQLLRRKGHDGLAAGVERLEEERDALVAEGIHRDAARWSLMVEAVAAQRDEAVKRVREVSSELEEWVDWGTDSVPDNALGRALALTRTFLLQPQPITLKCERVSVCWWCHDPNHISVEHPFMVGKKAGSGAPSYRCATHHGPFPSGTKRCPAALAGNVTG